ncbi:hypothetical protein KDA00_04340 [Candidatus Saccharibacteria bacterium]|nr:hypothetical protein [Candidatus Saccharibacteria bacterium]
MNINSPIRKTFTPCGTCEAREALCDSGTVINADFGIALDELKRRSDGFDDSGRPVAVDNNDIDDVALMCDLEGYSALLGACYERKASGQCTAGEIQNLDVKEGLL